MTQWRKSNRSADTGQTDCVELAALPGAVGMRDSKDQHGPKLMFAVASFRDLVADIKRGVHDVI